jgi:cytochrome P450
MERLQPLIRHYSEGLINIDPPEHRRLRRVLQGVFRPSVIQGLAPAIAGEVDRLLGRACAAKMRMEVISEFSHPLPVTVISDMYGVPREQAHLFVKWSEGIVRFMQSVRPSLDVCLSSQENLMEMRQFIQRGIEERRRKPSDDLLSLMVNEEFEGERLTDEEILSTSVTVLIGGHETTTRLFANTVHELIAHPMELAFLQENPDAMETAFLEFMRYCGSFHRDQRVVTEDLELAGKAVGKGQTLLLMLQSANRDPAIFEEPEQFNVRRGARKHLGFGSGPHVCLGAHLASLEVSIAMRAFLERCPDLRLLEEPEWEFGFLRGPKCLNVAFG